MTRRMILRSTRTVRLRGILSIARGATFVAAVGFATAGRGCASDTSGAPAATPKPILAPADLESPEPATSSSSTDASDGAQPADAGSNAERMAETAPEVEDVDTASIGVMTGSGSVLGSNTPDAADLNAAAAGGITSSAGVSVESARVHGGSIANVARVIMAMRPAFRACYTKALESKPGQHGVVALTIRVAADGRVASARSRVREGRISPALASCVTNRVKAAQFAAPDRGTVVLEVPVTFVGSP